MFGGLYVTKRIYAAIQTASGELEKLPYPTSLDPLRQGKDEMLVDIDESRLCLIYGVLARK